MRRKIFFYYMVLVVIGISVTGFFTAQLTQGLYKKDVEDRLLDIGHLIIHQISVDLAADKDIDYNHVALRYAVLLNTVQTQALDASKSKIRITFIQPDGTVIGESEADYRAMENHRNRKEVMQALEGVIGKDIRFSSTLNVHFFYLTMPVNEAGVILRLAVPLVQLRKITNAFFLYTFLGIAIGLILTALLAYKFSSSITKPVSELITASNEIYHGNYTKKVNIQAKDEMAQLTQTFNKMAENLHKTVAELTDKNVKLDSVLNSMTDSIAAVDQNYRIILINSNACKLFGIEDKDAVIGMNFLQVVRNYSIHTFLQETVTKNIPSVNEITLGPPQDKILRIYTNPIHYGQNEDSISGSILAVQDITNVKKLEQIRTEFVSNVTHELKTPLTSIRGFVETLRAGAMEDADVSDKFLEIIDIEAERLYILINDILQLSEIESKQTDTNIGTYTLKEIVLEVLPLLRELAEKKKVALLDRIDDTIVITANKDRIKQMLINLIDNAIKYNTEHGSVWLDASKHAGRVVIKVKDTGIGIPKEHLPRIFERFYRVDKGRSRNLGGTGLGLSIVKHIVHLYHGDVKVTSEPGKGTTFIVQLPV